MNVKQTKFQGGCHCGAIKYRIEGINFAADFCHCPSCQTITGSPISAWMDLNTEQVAWFGDQPKEYKSSKLIRRGFCDNCGSSITYRHINHPEFTTLAITSLDNPNLVRPNYHTYTESQLDWIVIVDDFPRYKKGKV